MMNLREFQNWALKQGVVGNPTKENSYKGECVSLIQQYLYRVFNMPFKPYGNAKDWENNYPSNFQKLASNTNIQKGDILVYGSNFGNGFGHLVIIDADGRVLEQNGEIKGRVSSKDKPYSGYVCILRSKSGVNIGSQDVFKVRVDKDVAYVRVQPTTKANTVKQPSGRNYLVKGVVFDAVELVDGEDPYNTGNNRWYKSLKGNYVWSGGLTRI